MKWAVRNLGLLALGMCVLAAGASVESKLNDLYQDSKAHRGCEMTVSEIMLKGIPKN